MSIVPDADRIRSWYCAPGFVIFIYFFLALHSCILSYIFYVESFLAQKAIGQDQHSRASKQKESKKQKKNTTSFKKISKAEERDRESN